MMETVLQRMAARTAAMRRSAVTVVRRDLAVEDAGFEECDDGNQRAQTDARRSAWLRYAVMVRSTPTKPVMMGTESRQTAAPARASPPAAMESGRPGAWRGLRFCDDGNERQDDACLSDCTLLAAATV